MNALRIINSYNEANFYYKLFNNKLTHKDIYKKSLTSLIDCSNNYNPNCKEFVKALIGIM